MRQPDFKEILKQFDIKLDEFTINPLGSGLVHLTYLIKTDAAFVLQKINTSIFKSPELIARNIKICGDFLDEKRPDYLFIKYIPTKMGGAYARTDKDFWRLSPFVENSYTKDLAENPDMAFQAGKAVGAFSKNLDGLDPKLISETIPHFHDLNYRFAQFEDALKNGKKDRIAHAEEWIEICLDQTRLNRVYSDLKKNQNVPVRIQHHDTKINNILFDQNSHKSIGLCDLDTIMPGYCISDLGDMIRTYTSSENEESTKWNEIKVRPDFYKALMKGYLSEMKTVLTKDEKKHLFYAGEFLIFMQAIRFLSDYLVGDVYYPVSHDLHNFNRAKNQLVLLENLQSQKGNLEEEINRLL